MYKEFSDYLRYSNLRYYLTQKRMSAIDKSLCAQALISLKCDIEKNLNDKITFLAWLEFNDRFFDKLNENEQKFLYNMLSTDNESIYNDKIDEIFTKNKYRKFYDNKLDRSK